MAKGTRIPQGHLTPDAYLCYLDGREESVRNAEFADIGLYTFKNIVKVSKTHAVWSILLCGFRRETGLT